jgi:hypothetical protein
MHITMAPKAALAVAFFCAGIAGCGTPLPTGYRTLSWNDQEQSKGQVCMVSDQSYRSLMTEPPHTCLIDSGHCDTTGSIQQLQLNSRMAIEPDARLNSPVNIDAK